MAADKQLGFKFVIEGISIEQQEIAKLEMALKNLRKEKDLIMKSGKPATQDDINKLASLNKEIQSTETNLKGYKKTVDSAADSLVRKKQRLIELKQLYEQSSEVVAKRLAPGIAKMTAEISKAEQAVGTHSRGVGNYKGAILDAGKSLIGFTGIVATVTAVMDKLKEAFAETERGTRFFAQASSGLKSFFQGIVGGEGLKESFKNAVLAYSIQDKFVDLQKEERKEMVEVAKKQFEINELRRKAVNASVSLADKAKALKDAVKAEDDIIELKLTHKREEIRLTTELLATRKNDFELANHLAELETEQYQIQSEKSVRLASKSEAAEKAVQEALKKSKDAQLEIERQFYKDKEDMQKYFFDKWKKMVDDEKNYNTAAFEEGLKELLGVKDKDLGLQQNKELADRQHKQYVAGLKDDEKLTKESEDRKKEYKLAALHGAEMGVSAAFDSKKARLQAEMTAELSNQNLTEQQKVTIQKKYAREQQRADITQAIINTALAIGNALATAKPFFPMAIIGSALAAIQGGIQVATIKAQKFASGGRPSRIVPSGYPNDTFPALLTSGETVLTQRHVGLLGGSGVMKRIGVPGYADGGYIGSRAPEIMSPAMDFSALGRMINDKRVVLEVHKLNKAQEEVNVIMQTQPI